MKRESIKSAYIALTLLITAISIGVAGYMVIEGWSFPKAFYMTIITVATVGFREVEPLSTVGMYFTTFLIVSSFGIFAYAVTTFIRYVVDGTFRHIFKDTRVKRKIRKLKNHVIVCGYGRNGKQAVHELMDHKVPVVIVENNETAMEMILDDPNLLYVYGDATKDEVLEMCYINNAKALITTLPVDADNLLVVLTAREINPTLTIISRGLDEHSDSKLRRAGANNIIMSDKIGGQRMAKLVTQPDIVEFLDFIMLQSSENMALEEISCKQIAKCFDGKSIRELDIRNESGANIIGLRREDRSYIVNPIPEIVLTSKDKIFALGTKSQIAKLKDLLYKGIGF
ncbi:MAG: potassium channel protein [Bacteroidales bacterium]|nr:MAG: potassium channel protein [Bacteroidales bacterium]